jgi:hypothetical protein
MYARSRAHGFAKGVHCPMHTACTTLRVQLVSPTPQPAYLHADNVRCSHAAAALADMRGGSCRMSGACYHAPATCARYSMLLCAYASDFLACGAARLG